MFPRASQLNVLLVLQTMCSSVANSVFSVPSSWTCYSQALPTKMEWRRWRGSRPPTTQSLSLSFLILLFYLPPSLSPLSLSPLRRLSLFLSLHFFIRPSFSLILFLFLSPHSSLNLSFKPSVSLSLSPFHISPVLTPTKYHLAVTQERERERH